jgi:TonB-dependent SusC/RagA subfamily outer membrane receptor
LIRIIIFFFKAKLMRFISTLCLLLLSSFCFSQIEDLIRKAEYSNTTVKIMPYICGFGRSSVSSLIDLSSLQGNMVRPKDSVLLKGLQIKVPDIYARITNKKDTVRKPETKIVLRCGNRYINETPLIIVNGVLQDSTHLSTLDPNDIESIDILKDAAASAIYGCRAAQGVIIITTKNAKLRKFIIKDFLDGNGIPGATVSFVSTNKKDTIMMSANDSGVVVTDKLKSSLNYEILISAIGYKSLNQNFKNSYGSKEQEVMLERDVKMCDEIIIGGGGHIIRCSRNYQCIKISECSMHTVTDTAYLFSFVPVKAQLAAGSIFPNPVQKGKAITIETTTQAEGSIEIKLTSLNGKLLLLQPQKVIKGMNRFSINTDPRWSAGIYFVQLYANGKLLASDKVIIQ